MSCIAAQIVIAEIAQIAKGTNDMLLEVNVISVIVGFNSLQLSNICQCTSVSEHNHDSSTVFDH